MPRNKKSSVNIKQLNTPKLSTVPMSEEYLIKSIELARDSINNLLASLHASPIPEGTWKNAVAQELSTNEEQDATAN
jgi:hypothetical protein